MNKIDAVFRYFEIFYKSYLNSYSDNSSRAKGAT